MECKHLNARLLASFFSQQGELIAVESISTASLQEEARRI